MSIVTIRKHVKMTEIFEILIITITEIFEILIIFFQSFYMVL